MRPAALRAGVALAGGAALPLAFAPFGWTPLALLAPAALFWLWRDDAPRRAALHGWLFGVGLFGVGASWIYISLHRFGGMGAPLALLAVLLFVAFLALFPAAAGALAALLARRLRRVGGAALLAFAALWTLFEWLRSWIFTGFPWLLLGHSQIDAPAAGIAPLAGALGVSLFVAVSAALTALIAADRGRRARAATALLALWAVAFAVDRIVWGEPAGAPLNVLLAQGNTPIEKKWRPEEQASILAAYREMTLNALRPAAGVAKIDLAVWPETAIPALRDDAAEFLEALDGELRAADAALFTGLIVREGGRYKNSVLALGAAEGLYHKRHLAPFGEYLPLRGLFGFLLDALHIPMSDLSPGARDQPPLHAAGHPVALSICYEAAYPHLTRDHLPQAHLLVTVSNDAWFGDSLAPHQHLQIARMRARETARPMLRATNTGVTALIDARGAVQARLPQFSQAALVGAVQPRAGATPYVRWGDWPALLIAAALIALALRRAVSDSRCGK